MKRFLAFITLCCLCVTTTEMRQFLKTPALVAHFVSHRSEQPDLSLFNFLVGHYVTENDSDADAQDDASLPFKNSVGDCLSLAPTVLPPVVVEVSPAAASHLPLIILNEVAVDAPLSRSLFQPPRA